MRLSAGTLLTAACLFSGSLANLRIPKPVIACKGIGKNCLRGQYCGPDNFCHNPPLESLFRPLSKRAPGDFSPDGRCGPQNGGLICDPNSAVYSGTCCSAAGWCGSSPAHCGEGCSSGCTPPSPTGTPPAGTSAPRPDGRCGRNYGGALCDAEGPFGGCCSEHGYCGSSPGHCLPSNGCQSGCTTPTPPGPTSTPPPGGVPTTDGTCGRENGNTICAGWPQGECCSLYGFCGNTLAHCGDGCQSGPCLEDGDPAPPGPSPAPITGGGEFTLIGDSGVPVMHAALTQNGRVIFLDKVEDFTKLRQNGRYAYSAEYDPQTNTVAALYYETNAFCAGGTFLANGDLVSLGGNGPLLWLDSKVGDGFTGIRYITRSATNPAFNGADWREPGNKLASARWYPSVQTLPDGRIWVVSGSLNGLDPTRPENNNPTFEILSPLGISEGENVPMDILVRNQPYYMYPFIHLLRDGKAFIFTAKSSEIYDINARTTTRTMPDLRGDYRTYPNSGGSVLLPLSSADGWASRVMVCGGGAYQDITSPTDASCGVIRPEDPTPRWEMDSMPEGRGMVEGTLLPDGTVLWMNGANRGAQGFVLATNPTTAALLYDPEKPLRQRWTQLASSSIPRMYHSVALLLLDGTVMVTGSNPNEMPVLTPRPDAPFITDFRVERFTPPYLQGANATRRPTNLVIPRKTLPADGTLFDITFDVPTTAQELKIALYYGGFVTHSVHMGHRMLFLERRNWAPGNRAQRITVRTPPNRNVCPPGPYVLYVVVDGIPSVGQFVQMT